MKRLIALALLVMVGCKNPTEDVVVHISPDFYDYAIGVELRDIANPDQILSVNQSFSIEGPAADDIFMIDGSRNFEFENGACAMLVNRQVLEPTPGNPILFYLKFDAEGYRPINKRIEITVNEFYSDELVYMLADNAQVNGLGSTSEKSSLINDALPQKVAIDFSTNSDNRPSDFNLALDSGITFKDRQGHTLEAGELEMNFTGFDTYSDNSTLSLPGSSLTQDVQINGRREKSFISAMSRLDIDLRADGTPVKSIDGGKLDMRVGIPNVTNPGTLTTYDAGDSIDMISYDDADGYWKYVKTCVVEEDSAGKYIRTQIDDFSTKTFTTIAENQQPVHVRFVLNGHIMLKNNTRVKVGDYRKLIASKSNSRFDIKLDPGLITFARFDPDAVRVTAITGSGVFSSVSSTPLDKRIAVQWNDAGDTIVCRLPVTQNIFKAGYRAYCVDNPQVLLYPPIGSKIFIKETGDPEYGQIPAHIVTTENKNDLEFQTSTVQEGLFYDVKLTYGGQSIKDTMNLKAVEGKVYDLPIPTSDCDFGL